MPRQPERPPGAAPLAAAVRPWRRRGARVMGAVIATGSVVGFLFASDPSPGWGPLCLPFIPLAFCAGASWLRGERLTLQAWLGAAGFLLIVMLCFRGALIVMAGR